MLKFGNAMTNNEGDDAFYLIPGAIVIGIIGGLIGPLFINLNTRTFWHEKMETPEMWNDAWKNRMGELPIRKPAVENTKICQSFKDQGLMKD